MSNEVDRERGRMLFQSSLNVRRSASALNGLYYSLFEKLGKSGIGQVGHTTDDYNDPDVDWIYTSYGFIASVSENPVKRREGQKGRTRKPTRLGDITILIRLSGNMDGNEADLDWPWLKEACLIIGWAAPDDWWELENFEPITDNTSCIQHCADGLWMWEQKDTKPSYFFVLPLFSLKSDANLDSYVIDPLKKLFPDKHPRKKAKNTFRDVPVLVPTSE